jgi:LmbE family N-acetylglucosaminyl deacetylase
MHTLARLGLGALLLATPRHAQSQGKVLVAILAHADDEAPIGPMLARYAREGVRVYMLIVSDGAQGAGQQGMIQRPDSIRPGEELARTRADEARCAAQALGLQPPILLGFPDGKLGDYIGDRSLLMRLTPRLADELAKLHPDAMVTWGPDGGTGHPDHRIVSDLATQLARFGAPGIPERLFYMNLLAEGMRAMNPARGEPPMLIPQAKYFTTRVSFTPADFEAAKRAMACHKTQITPEVAARIVPAMERSWNGVIMLIPAFSTSPATDLFR